MNKDKRFIIRKYVTAPTAAEAIQREVGQPVDEVYLETPEQPKGAADAIGFHAHIDPDWRDSEVIARRKR